jgi:hypothetical protein
MLAAGFHPMGPDSGLRRLTEATSDPMLGHLRLQQRFFRIQEVVRNARSLTWSR